MVQLSHSVVSNSLQPHGLQRTRLPCPTPTPRQEEKGTTEDGITNSMDMSLSKLQELENSMRFLKNLEIELPYDQ